MESNQIFGGNQLQLKLDFRRFNFCHKQSKKNCENENFFSYHFKTVDTNCSGESFPIAMTTIASLDIQGVPQLRAS